jgi:hypothetical protein
MMGAMRTRRSSHGSTACVVQMRMALLFPIRIGNRKMATTLSASKNEWVAVPDDAVITEPTAMAEPWSGRPRGRSGLQFAASCRAA